MTKLNREHLLGLSCLILAGVTYALASQLPKGQNAIGVSGPALFPNILATILAFGGLAELFVGFRKSDSVSTLSFVHMAKQLRRPEVLNVFLIIGLWILYELLFVTLGFIITTLVFLFVIMARLGVSIRRSITISGVYVLVIYAVFTLLFSISLPAGILSVLGM